jgi:hypothetical protein
MCGWVVRGCRSGGDQPVRQWDGPRWLERSKIMSKTNHASRLATLEDQHTLAGCHRSRDDRERHFPQA